jgi:outer membrane protein
MRPKIDVTRAEVGVSQAQLDLIATEYGLQESIISFEKLLGGPPVTGSAYSLSEEIPSAPPSPDLQSLIEMALEERSELASLKAQVKGAESDLLSTKRSAYPSLNASGSYSYYGEELPLEDQRWQVGISLSWPLFTGFNQTGQVNESEAEMNRLKAQLENSNLSVTEEVTRAYFQLKTAEEAIKTAENTLKQAKENLDIAQGRYQAGVSDVIELSDAQMLYTESRSALVQAVYDHHKAQAGLEFAVGGQIIYQIAYGPTEDHPYAIDSNNPEGKRT